MAGGDARVFPVIFDKTRRVAAYGTATGSSPKDNAWP